MQSQIKLRIKDAGGFRLVALLVDRPDFLRDIEQIRRASRLGLTNLMPYERVLNHLKELGKTSGENTGQLFNQNGDTPILVTKKEVVESIDWLKSKYLKNSSFDMVFAYAIYAGEVRDNAIKRTAYVQYLDKHILENFTLDGRYQVSIVISPDTSPHELTMILNTEVSQIFPDWPKRKNRLGKLERDREWYWLRKQLTWGKLFSHINKNRLTKFEHETIRSAVRYYESRLSAALYSNNPPGELKTS